MIAQHDNNPDNNAAAAAAAATASGSNNTILQTLTSATVNDAQNVNNPDNNDIGSGGDNVGNDDADNPHPQWQGGAIHHAKTI